MRKFYLDVIVFGPGINKAVFPTIIDCDGNELPNIKSITEVKNVAITKTFDALQEAAKNSCLVPIVSKSDLHTYISSCFEIS